MSPAVPDRFAVVIPALNEVRAIRDVVTGALAQCPTVIVVDDGSDDGTADAIADLPVVVLRHAQRMGKGAALENGFAEALRRGADAVLTLDGDGQHDAADLPRLAAAHAQRPDAVIVAARLIGRESQPRIRRFANHFADFWVSWACGQWVRDSQCGQRLYPKALIAQLPARMAGGFAFESDVLIEASQRGFGVAAVPIRARYHQGLRPSHFRPLLDVLRITRNVGRHLLGRGFYPTGLVGALRRPALEIDV